MDFAGYFAALQSDWVGLMSGVGSIVLTLLGFRWKDHVRRTFWICGLVCFVLASIRVWTTEHRKVSDLSSPRIEGTIEQMDLGTVEGKPMVMFWVSLRNRGTDSIVDHYTLTVTMNNGELASGTRTRIPQSVTFADRDLKFDNADSMAIYEKTSEQPIVRGGARSGIIEFLLDPRFPLDKYRQKGTRFNISCADINESISQFGFSLTRDGWDDVGKMKGFF